MKPMCLAVFSGLRGLLVLLVGVALSSCGSSPSSSPTSPSPLVTAVSVQPGGNQSNGNQSFALLSGIGQTVQLTASAAVSVGEQQKNPDVTSLATWLSSNAAVATVSGGLVTAVAAGTVTIAATYEGKTGTANISVALGSVMTATVDGVAFNGVKIGVQLNGPQLLVVAQDGSYNFLTVAVPPTAGTYNLTSQAGLTWVSLSDGPGNIWYSDDTGGGGTLTISTLTSTSVSGTFSATLGPDPGTPGTKVITHGVFNVRF